MFPKRSPAFEQGTQIGSDQPRARPFKGLQFGNMLYIVYIL
jgi:hypothetical protein